MGANFEQMDGIFRKQLRNYSQSVPDDIWGDIEQVLDNSKKAKRITIYKIAAAVAAFAIISSTYFYLSNNNESFDNKSIIVDNNLQQESENEANIFNQEKINEKIADNFENKKIEELDIENQKIIAEANLAEIKFYSPNNLMPVESDIEKKEKNLEKLSKKQISIKSEDVELAIIDVRKQRVKAYLNSLPEIDNYYALNDFIEDKEPKNSKWILGGEFSPLYSYRYIAEAGGDYNQDYYNSAENPIMSYTGGLNLQYKAINRLTVQAGVYYTTMGQSFDYLSVYANTAYDMVAEEYKDRFINSYSITNSAGDVSFNSPYVIIDEKLIRVSNLSDSKGVADVSDPIFNNLDAEIQQSFQYVEVPFLMRYKLIDKNIDFNIVGGFGANFLIGNDVYLKYASNKEVIGETKGVNTINYNSTLGFGIEYPLMDRINIRLEPSIKYYLNEINSSSSVESHLYSIGIYAGVNYSF
jgi:hypothetical protein